MNYRIGEEELLSRSFSISLFFPFNFNMSLYQQYKTKSSHLIVFHRTKQNKDAK
jgi:hypothetical protein